MCKPISLCGPFTSEKEAEDLLTEKGWEKLQHGWTLERPQSGSKLEAVISPLEAVILTKDKLPSL